jgi:hypothetical protein
LCYSGWSGDLTYAGSKLSVRACPKQDLCSAEIEVHLRPYRPPSPPEPGACPPAPSYPPPPSGWCTPDTKIRTVGDFSVEIWFDRGAKELAASTSFGLGVGFTYDPPVSATLSDGDQRELSIKSEDGQVLVHNVNQTPYTTHPTPNGQTCKAVRLNFDGTVRQVPTG